MTGQQLKNSILQLAVQGKLVPQDPSDEPASVLLERIRKEKERLIAEGKIKKEKNPSVIFRGADNLPYEKVGKNEPVCIADEVPFELPENWCWCRLKSIAFVNGGYAFKSHNYTHNGYRVIRISDFNENGFVNTKIVRHPYDESLSMFLLKNKDILLCMTGGTVGKSLFVKELSEPMLTNQRVATIRSLGISEEYLYMVILSPITQAVITFSKNSTNDNISMDTINDFYIPLPPLDEQKRIVSQYKEILPLIDDYNKLNFKISSLNSSFPELLKKSILQEAVQGKLVPQDQNDEPASILLERIRAEKQRLIKEGKIKKDKNESVIFRRDNSHYEKRNGKEVCIDEEIPFEIPLNWCWCRLGSILTKITDGTHSTPKYTANGVPFISVKDISSGYIDFSNTKYISADEHQLLSSRCDPRRDDILLTKVGTTGIPVLVETDEEFSLFVSVAQLRFSIELLDKHYLIYLLKSPLVQIQCQENTRGVGNKNWVMRDIVNTLIAIPPLSEQHRIVEYLNTVLPNINKIKFPL